MSFYFDFFANAVKKDRSTDLKNLKKKFGLTLPSQLQLLVLMLLSLLLKGCGSGDTTYWWLLLVFCCRSYCCCNWGCCRLLKGITSYLVGVVLAVGDVAVPPVVMLLLTLLLLLSFYC